MKNKELQQYIQSQIVQSQKRLEGLSSDVNNNPFFKRGVYSVLEKYASDFLVNRGDPRVIVMPGLRGTGKTTLLAQLFLSLTDINISKLYLSVEEAIRRFDVNLWDIIENYELLIDKQIEEFNTPLFLFFDEIHYDKNWSIFLKTMYDRSKNVMVFCTGSAALLLREQINADVARRVFFVDIYPVSFSEYMLFKHNKCPVEEVGETIREAILFSNSSEEVFDKLLNEKEKVSNYWFDIGIFEVQRYIKLGTLPFTLRSENEVLSATFVSQTINKVIHADISQFYNFEMETINKIDKMLYLIAGTLGVSATKLCEVLEIKLDTLRLILKALENSGLVTRIPPYGSHFKQVKKASKYLFATPALRFSYLATKESVGVFENYKGSLYEDIIGMYLNRILPKFGDSSLTYDVAEGGADFVISMANKKIVIEVGAGYKDYKQIIKSSKKVNSRYNLIIADDELEYSKKLNAVKIPWNYFLLI